ncbi:QacE family quaternary ammonium compound efflux SMR transporter [Paracoccus liaowanqingii]|uniref:QacE family quaternary ammonium compound efflux SMR transporter n=1 Tax=Paracoccus liaowanqingii TaxID=2560053 RepID=A0A4Z1C070_9RHOB|nr:SMR family transporter [Paracoccus liaowanqingii]QDA35901.1 QacE family quaternary ammonium compound efflux SMR transporter [Paracoccus liaowanqingii]TGN51327.1 QacE family quaternary ammonium compound efflux SMR transporter [Paracoccus liaowanqingii]
MPSSTTYLILGTAVVAEVIATTALSRSENLSRLVPSVITVCGYSAAIWLMSFPMRVMPTGVVYAIWSGMGIVLITCSAWIWFGQKLDAPAMVGLGFILVGVLIVNILSETGVP